MNAWRPEALALGLLLGACGCTKKTPEEWVTPAPSAQPTATPTERLQAVFYPPPLGAEVADYPGGSAFSRVRLDGSALLVNFEATAGTFDRGAEVEAPNAVGEVWIPLPRYANMQGASLKWTLSIDIEGGQPEAKDFGAQVIIRTNNEHNIEAKQYGAWVNGRLPCKGCDVKGTMTMLADDYPATSFTDSMPSNAGAFSSAKRKVIPPRTT